MGLLNGVWRAIYSTPYTQNTCIKGIVLLPGQAVAAIMKSSYKRTLEHKKVLSRALGSIIYTYTYVSKENTRSFIAVTFAQQPNPTPDNISPHQLQ